MKLHARNLAASMGAKGVTIERIIEKISERKLKVTFDTVKEIYDEVKEEI